ncbi:MAG TPA: efflux RND transporter permease subunit [Pseudomonadales bacterium]
MNSGRQTNPDEGLIAWFANNPVAANLLMIMILVVGFASALHIRKSITPDFESNLFNITMVYPGAAPAEVEKGIIIKIEESIKDVEGIERIESTAAENIGTVRVETNEDYSLLDIMNEVKNRVDGISSFPIDAEKPSVSQIQRIHQALQIQVYGSLDEFAIKHLAEEVRLELLSNPEIARVDLWGARDFEISVEIPEATLRKHGLTLSQVAETIRQSSLDLPGGSIRTENGDIQLRTRGQAYTQQDFENIILLTSTDGTRVRLGDIATINDGFVELKGFATFNGLYSVGLAIYAVGGQDVIKVAEEAKHYVEEKRKTLPEGVYLDTWADTTYYLQGRLSMMVKNLILGAFLVLIVLGLFMDLKIAFWVMIGMPICFLGTFALMPLVDVSLNMISLFGFILVLGILVDDAIIIGESVHSTVAARGHSLRTVIEGTQRVALPATFGVLTTIVAFSPTLFVDGVFRNFPAACGWVVLLCLTFSLIESKLILPAHLAEMQQPFWRWALEWRWQERLQERCNAAMNRFVIERYQPAMEACIRRRYVTAASFLAMLIVTLGLIGGGVVRYIMTPQVAGDFIVANIEMVEGTAEQRTLDVIKNVNQTIYTLNQQYQAETGSDQGFIKHVFAFGSQGLIGSVWLELVKSESREIDSDTIANRWREAVGEIPGTRVLSFSTAQEGSGPPIAFTLTSNNILDLEQAGQELADKLKTYNGVHDVRNSASDVVDEIQLTLTPEAETLGITLADLGRQVREAFYGAEAQRIQRGTDELKVMVRYPRADRKSVSTLESMYIVNQQGDRIPFATVANIDIRPGYSKITRINSRRSVLVSADITESAIEPARVIQDLEANFLPELKTRMPHVGWSLDGGSKEAKKLERSLFVGFSLALASIYILLAVPLRSYLQPLIIMSVIPFGIIGAVAGHLLMDKAISMMSVFGIIALAGVVVNDSLIMVDFVNQALMRGKSLMEAVISSGTERFRAIMLTSLTTFFGLLPMLLESSVQAQFVIPMAISLGFGIIFATVITLLLVPTLYVILDDLRRLVGLPGYEAHHAPD